ncbi:hypothetical protein AB0J38_08040 [Streptomyces sp. NPDC050095]|uniref:hypothetical protein n=1 Tax=unclassified Streptomyces TaxID=2593676 RepID=UPI003439BAC3
MSTDVFSLSPTPAQDRLTVRGGNPVHGRVQVSGFKHVMVLAVAYAIGSERRTVLTNVPDILETHTYLELLPQLGVSTSQAGSSLVLAPGAAPSADDPTASGGAVLPQAAEGIHGSLYLLPPLLARRGRVGFSGFGGCPIGSAHDRGARPWRHIVRVLERFGARFDAALSELTLPERGYRATELDLGHFADDQTRLTGPEYSGATKAAVLAAAFADGTTVLRRPYRKAEVESLLRLLERDGVHVLRADDRIEITPRPAHRQDLLTYDLPPDLLEVVTWATVAAVTGGEIHLSNVSGDTLRDGLNPEYELWRTAGLEFTETAGGITVSAPRDGAFGPLPEIRVDPASIYSDSQPLFTVLATRCPGPTRIVDGVWKGRYNHLDGLAALGADVHGTSDGIVVGAAPLEVPAGGVQVHATDLRCAAALVVAALAADGGPVRITGTHHLNRGYDHLPQKLADCLVDAPLLPSVR